MDKYERHLAYCEKQADILRDKLTNRVKPDIEQMALSVGMDLVSHQLGCSVTDNNYKYDNKKAEKFTDFIHKLSDEHGVEFYFEVVDGKFTWFD